MEQIIITISAIITVLTLVTMLYGFRDKIFHSGTSSQKNDDRITNLEKSDISIQENISNINNDIKKIKENHLAHIQADINIINIRMERMETTLEFIKNK